LPVLVIAPCRRRSPLEYSLGVRPRNGPSDGSARISVYLTGSSDGVGTIAA
jgi:hypothetical protein